MEKLKGFWDSQVNDEEQWALNYVRTLPPRPLLPSSPSCSSPWFVSSPVVVRISGASSDNLAAWFEVGVVMIPHSPTSVLDSVARGLRDARLAS